MKIHFIGIGGIGVSALAQYYLAKGHNVSGSDLASSEITDFLKKSGAKIFIGQNLAKNLAKDVDLVIHSPAVSLDNPEIKKAEKLNIKIQSYPKALGELTKKYFTIAISGTHGKSTTSAMTALILIKAGLDPTVIVGTKLKEFNGTNFRIGKSKYLVIEADEWQASFLNYWPKIIVLTNIEREHLDYYKDLKHILKTYKEYVNHLPEDGLLIANGDDKNIPKLKKLLCDNKVSRDNCSQKSKPHPKSQKYSLRQKETRILRKILKVPGEYNIYNALAALTMARALKVPDKTSFKALSQYTGAWRRFEIKKGEINGKKFTIISDYAHHPTEIAATLLAIRHAIGPRRLIAVFQPHRPSRMQHCLGHFGNCFRDADCVWVTDIYQAGESAIPGVSQEAIVA